MNSNHSPIVRQLQVDGAFEVVHPTKGPRHSPLAINVLGVDPGPEALIKLASSIEASQLANLILHDAYRPEFDGLCLAVARLQSICSRDPGGMLQWQESEKPSVYAASGMGEISCVHVARVCRSFYSSDIIVSANVQLREIQFSGLCELSRGVINDLAPPTFKHSEEMVCLRLAPGSQVTVGHDVASHWFLSLSRNCPLEHPRHENYVTRFDLDSLKHLPNPPSDATGISLQPNCWTVVKQVNDPADGALTDYTIELAVTEDGPPNKDGSLPIHRASLRVTRWASDIPGEEPCVVLQCTGEKPVYLALFPR